MDNPQTTYNLGGSAITLAFLETLIETCNRYGEVKLVNVGETSLMQLAVNLLEASKTNKG